MKTGLASKTIKLKQLTYIIGIIMVLTCENHKLWIL